MQSTSSADGGYTLTVTFALGTDPDINTVNVQNRVTLADPLLPEEVRRQVSVRGSGLPVYYGDCDLLAKRHFRVIGAMGK